MCGRYVSPDQASIERAWNIRRGGGSLFPARYNVAPSTNVPVIRMGQNGRELELTEARWGLIPHWWKEAKLPSHTFNARSEDVASKPMWRFPYRHSRCLIPALGWYEWKQAEVINKETGEVTQDNIQQTICVSGWTKTIRPATSYTNKLKVEQIKEYRYKDKTPSHYEEDHLISLQLGGHPTDPKNLWPQAYDIRCGARIKDVLETRLKRLVCDGKLSLADAQKAIAANWVAAYKKYVNREGCPALEQEQ